MTERWDRQREAQITSKMHELIACMCVVTFKQGGDRRGMIERIESLAIGKDFPESFEQSQFTVHLTSGDIVIVAGSAISAIESTNANRQPKRSKKAPGKKGPKSQDEKHVDQKRKVNRGEGHEGSSNRARTKGKTTEGAQWVAGSWLLLLFAPEQGRTEVCQACDLELSRLQLDLFRD